MFNELKYKQMEADLETAQEEAAFLSDPDMNRTKYVVPQGVRVEISEIKPNSFNTTYRPTIVGFKLGRTTIQRVFSMVDFIQENNSRWYRFRTRKNGCLYAMRVLKSDVIVQEGF